MNLERDTFATMAAFLATVSADGEAAEARPHVRVAGRRR